MEAISVFQVHDSIEEPVGYRKRWLKRIFDSFAATANPGSF